MKKFFEWFMEGAAMAGMAEAGMAFEAKPAMYEAWYERA